MSLYDDWEFNVLGVYNYRKPGPLKNYFDYIIENHDRIEGNVVEAGVFKGRSLMAAGLLLKELGSSKRVYGYDTFSGFPPVYHANDDPTEFEALRERGAISQEHFDKVQRNLKLRSLDLPGDTRLSASTLSLSGDFSSASQQTLQQKLDHLGLDNVTLIAGPFAETMLELEEGPGEVMACLLDCDLYDSYSVALPFVWNRLSVGGYIFLDEYYSLKFPGARIATDEFFAAKTDKPQRHKMEVGDFERWYVRRLVA